MKVIKCFIANNFRELISIYLYRRRMMWIGDLAQLKEDLLPTRLEAMKQPGRREWDKPKLRWEDCLKRDLRKADDEGKWREKVGRRGKGKQLGLCNST